MTRCPPGTKCRGVVPALSHIMLQSDDLAREFNDILNGVEIFAPFQPLDPAVTFSAPLRNTVRDLRLSAETFSRDSEAWYLDASGIYRRASIGAPRFENSQLLMEPASTNKCENYNANPDPALTNVNPGAATASLVAAPAELLALGLSDICSDGNVIELHNEGGGPTNAGITGAVGNLNSHAVSAWMNTFGSVVEFGVSDNRQLVSTVGWERVTVIATPTGTWNTWQIRLDPGERVQFILNQLEEAPVVMSPIVTEGTAGQRALDTLNYLPAAGFFNQLQGMAMVTVSFPWAFAPGVLRSNSGVLSVSGLAFSAIYIRNEVDTGADFRSYIVNTNVGVETTWQADDVFYVALRWNDPISQIGFRRNNEPWVWDPAYTNPSMNWALDGFIRLCLDSREPKRIGNVQIFNEDYGTAWIEANYP